MRYHAIVKETRINEGGKLYSAQCVVAVLRREDEARRRLALCRKVDKLGADRYHVRTYIEDREEERLSVGDILE